MANPKLLQEIVIDSTNDVFGFTLGGAQTATIAAGRYDTILEVLAELEDRLQDVDPTFTVAVSSLGIVSIACVNAWTVNWTTTDTALRLMLGYSATDAVTGSGPYTLTATNRHLYGWYAPVGVEYPGIRRRVARRYQETDDGSATAYASSATHRYVTLTFDALLEAHIEPEVGGVADDGAGGTVDWTGRTLLDFWVDIASKTFRYYADAATGTVSNPGAYWELYRTDDELEPEQLDPQSYTYFRVTLPCQIISIVA